MSKINLDLRKIATLEILQVLVCLVEETTGYPEVSAIEFMTCLDIMRLNRVGHVESHVYAILQQLEACCKLLSSAAC